MKPFEVYVDAPGDELPGPLRDLYGGGLSFPSPALYCNFVSSIDGVVAVEGVPSSGSLVSGKSAADRFVMGLARACADGVLMGAGTLRATPGHRWTAEHIYPDLAPAFADMRRQRGLQPAPRLILVTGSGDIDVAHPGLSAGAMVVTTEKGAQRLRRTLPGGCDVVVAGDGDRVPIEEAVGVARKAGLEILLSEAGPHINAQLLEKDLLDEVMLTVSPLLAGRAGAGDLGMVEGVRLLPGHGAWQELISLRRHGNHLFLHYRRGIKPA